MKISIKCAIKERMSDSFYQHSSKMAPNCYENKIKNPARNVTNENDATIGQRSLLCRIEFKTEFLFFLIVTHLIINLADTLMLTCVYVI